MTAQRTLHLHMDGVLASELLRVPAIKRRLELVIRHLAVRGTTSNVKLVRGAGRGWRRTQLGGNHGSHYYLWWAPQGTPPVRHLAELRQGDVVLRAVRHHDETDRPLDAGALDAFYPATGREVLAIGSEEALLNDEQQGFAASAEPVRILVGHPGTGKTTALWEAANRLRGRRVLYLTLNPSLAEEAARFFAELGEAEVQTMTPGQLVAVLDAPPDAGWSLRDAMESLDRLLRREWLWEGRLGPWERAVDELFCELYGVWFGRALPVAFRNQPAAERFGSDAAAYGRLRDRDLGREAADVVARVGERLRREGAEARLFAPLHAAWRAIEALDAGVALPPALRVDAVVVDELQDLTLLEQWLLVRLCMALQDQRGEARLLVTGDEGQTLLPSAFEWGPFADLVSSHLGRHERHELVGNVRSPRPVVELVNRSWDLYGALSKAQRPRGYARAGAAEAGCGQVFHVALQSEAEAERLLSWLDAVPGRRAVHPRPFHDGGDRVSTSLAEKGLDYQVVAVWDAGRVMAELRQSARPTPAMRSAIDGLRVALSRSTETLLLVDLQPSPEALAAVRELCAGVPEFTEAGCEDVLALLDAEDDRDAEQLVQDACEEAYRLLGRDDRRAHRQAGLAVALLGRAGAPAAVADEALRRQAWRMLGVAACRLGPARWGEAAEALREGGEGTTADAVRAVLAAVGVENPLAAAEEAARAWGLVDRAAPEVRETLLQALRGWAERAAEGSLEAVPEKALRALESVAERLPEALLPRLLEDHARRRMEAGEHAKALAIWQRLGDGFEGEAARCLEALRRWRDAALAYERRGSLRDALRCWREVPDPVEALRVAEDAETAGTLRLLVELKDGGLELTAAEQTLALQALRRLAGTAQAAPAGRRKRR